MLFSITLVYTVNADNRHHARVTLAQALRGIDGQRAKLEFLSVRESDLMADEREDGWGADFKAAIRDLLLGPNVAAQQPVRRRRS